VLNFESTLLLSWQVVCRKFFWG